MEGIDESFVTELDHVEEEALSYQKKMMARMGGPKEWEHNSTPSLLCKFFMVLWRDTESLEGGEGGIGDFALVSSCIWNSRTNPFQTPT